MSQLGVAEVGKRTKDDPYGLGISYETPSKLALAWDLAKPVVLIGLVFCGYYSAYCAERRSIPGRYSDDPRNRWIFENRPTQTRIGLGGEIIYFGTEMPITTPI
jgi:hypothetical protein